MKSESLIPTALSNCNRKMRPRTTKTLSNRQNFYLCHARKV